MSTEKDVEPTNQGRRDLLKLSLAAGATMVAASTSDAADTPPAVVIPPSPAVTPWREEIPAYTYRPYTPVPLLDPAPQETANLAAGEMGRNPLQKFAELYARQPDLYELHLQETMHVFHPDYPAQPIWGFGGTYPGPTFYARYGKPAIVRLFNELPTNHVGFGTPETTMHLHNLHTGSESDGFPGDYWSRTKFGPTVSAPGTYKDHFYPNVYAGYEKSRETDPNAIGDSREALGTL